MSDLRAARQAILVRTTSRRAFRRWRRQSRTVIEWRVHAADGRRLGWVFLEIIMPGRQCRWLAAAPFVGWVPVKASNGRRPRGRDAVAALLAYHGLADGDR